MSLPKPKIAIVLFNLGGPDTQEAVQPFLFNLFNDPAIISVLNPLRWLLAKFISTRRAPIAKEIYQKMGGGSPLLPLTKNQAEALEKILTETWNAKVFICMRYWHPMSTEVAMQIKEYAPDQIIGLPLYPQYSTTTTASSFKDFKIALKREGVNVPISEVCCYPTHAGMMEAHANLIRPSYVAASLHGKPRILFSAHGLPEKVIKAGDPYQWQVEKTSARIAALLGLKELDWQVCYQSRVGPLKWIGPSTIEEITRAGNNKTPLVVVPVAFVSEHSETLVELDIEYKHIADKAGVPFYTRVPALGDNPQFIKALAEICEQALDKKGVHPGEGKSRFCQKNWRECPCAA